MARFRLTVEESQAFEAAYEAAKIDFAQKPDRMGVFAPAYPALIDIQSRRCTRR
jgi:hypothetical protein